MDPEHALLLVPLALAAALLRDAVRARRPTRFFLRGRYAEARAAWDRLERSWMRVLPRVRNAARYGSAASLHMLGDFAGSLAVLARIDRSSLDRSATYAVASLEAANLVLANAELERAVEVLEQLGPDDQAPEDVLFLAHARHALGDAAEASALFARAGTSRSEHQRGHGHHAAVFHTMRGLFLLKLGRADEAMADFARSAAVPFQNWYTHRARALLPPLPSDGDPRSSLSGQVLDER